MRHALGLLAFIGLVSGLCEAKRGIPPATVARPASVCDIVLGLAEEEETLWLLDAVVLREDAWGSALTEPGCPEFGMLVIEPPKSSAFEASLEEAFRRSTYENWIGVRAAMLGNIREVVQHQGHPTRIFSATQVLDHRIVPADSERARFLASVPPEEVEGRTPDN